MKPRLTPIDIILKDLPSEGREYVYTRETGELDKHLKDLIGDNAYDIRFRITPMGNAYNLKGEVKTAMNLQCSLCAVDFKYLVQQPLHEFIVPQKPMGKGDRQTHANHAHELEGGGPDYILLETEVFKVADYIHELVALAEPIRPIGRPNCDENCENVQDRIQREWLSFGEEHRKDGIQANPFQVLEKLKLKS